MKHSIFIGISLALFLPSISYSMESKKRNRNLFEQKIELAKKKNRN